MDMGQVDGVKRYWGEDRRAVMEQRMGRSVLADVQGWGGGCHCRD